MEDRVHVQSYFKSDWQNQNSSVLGQNISAFSQAPECLVHCPSARHIEETR